MVRARIQKCMQLSLLACKRNRNRQDSGKTAMKKTKDPSPPIASKAFLEFIINHIVEVVQITSTRKQTRTQKQAAQILARCLANRYEANRPSPFSDSDKSDTVVDASQLWLSGDLAIGRGGPEFMYVSQQSGLSRTCWLMR